MDANADYRIAATEMMDYIAHWKAGHEGYGASVMMQGIALWKAGECLSGGRGMSISPPIAARQRRHPLPRQRPPIR